MSLHQAPQLRWVRIQAAVTFPSLESGGRESLQSVAEAGRVAHTVPPNARLAAQCNGRGVVLRCLPAGPGGRKVRKTNRPSCSTAASVKSGAGRRRGSKGAPAEHRRRFQDRLESVWVGGRN